VLEMLEGHFIRGYGDTQKPDVEIELLPGAADTAAGFLASHLDSNKRLKRVAELIDGFETPYGMELLASVHWVAVRSSPLATTTQEAIAGIQNWNERKHRMFRAEHIRVAWER